MKPVTYSIAGLLIGALIGAMAGLGELAFIKKSQTEALAPLLITVSAMAFGIGGARIGYNMGDYEKKSDELGLTKSQDYMFKDGRFWVAVTKWTDPKTQIEHSLLTARSNFKVLVSQLDEVVIINHHKEGANKENISKFHLQAKAKVFEQFRKYGKWNGQPLN